MPARNVIRSYTENGYYHIYNRGVEKRIIFEDVQDYSTFLYYLFVYLAPSELVIRRYPKINWNLKKNNLHGKITLLAYCLMPNHFHLLVRQADIDAVTKLMRRLTSAYTEYFNKRNKRTGALVQGIFKAKYLETEEYLFYLNKYIHRNPLGLVNSPLSLRDYPWSSYPIYLAKRQSSYLDTTILAAFSDTYSQLSYQSFVEESDDILLPSSYLIDNDEPVSKGGTLNSQKQLAPSISAYLPQRNDG